MQSEDVGKSDRHRNSVEKQKEMKTAATVHLIKLGVHTREVGRGSSTSTDTERGQSCDVFMEGAGKVIF